ncbi:MAG: hypothetical protein K9L57_09595, partial [Spirochaetaceae bacterium]|nr:hypothetical protein [Spirochaetaceae bacterium]
VDTGDLKSPANSIGVWVQVPSPAYIFFLYNKIRDKKQLLDNQRCANKPRSDTKVTPAGREKHNAG